MARATAVSADARRANAATVFDYLLANSPCSRKDLREATGLVSGTVTAIVADLIERGLARETGELVATGGRPQRLIEAVPERLTGVVMQVTTTAVHGAAVDGSGRVLAEMTVPHTGARHGREALLVALAEVLGSLVEGVRAVGAWYAGAIVCVPGLVTDRRTMLITLDMPIRNFAIVDELAGVVEHPEPITLLNSGRTSALAQWSRLPLASRPSDLAYVDIHDYGVSGGLVSHGEIVGGEHGLAGETGHIVVESGGRLCECGARGCLSTVLSLKAMADGAGVPWGEGAQAVVAHLVEALEAGEDAAVAALERAASGLAAAVATLSNLTDVGLVVVGGVAAPLEPWLRPAVDEMLSAREVVNPVFNPSIRFDRGVGGAAAALREGMLAELWRSLRNDPLVVEPVRS